MPGYLVHQGATVTCKHLPGQATPVTVITRVKVSGQAIVTQAGQYAITGCALTGTAPPCATATWITAALRVTSGGSPVILDDSQSTCIAPGTPLSIVMTQKRVKGM